MQKIDVFWHEDALKLERGSGVFDQPPDYDLLEFQVRHIENRERIANMRSVLEKGPVSEMLNWCAGRHATEDEILLFHTADHLESLKQANLTGQYFGSSTFMPKNSLNFILSSAGTTVEAAISACTSGKPTIALVRPPGHHCGPNMADGYCFLNNLGIAVASVIHSGLVKRVAVIDWDAHHGNGTQTGFYERSDVFTISTHMDHGPWSERHLETGKVDERGAGQGFGYNLNLPLPLGAGDRTYLEVFDRFIAPSVKEFSPDLIVVANGQDASQFDPAARQSVTMRGFNELGKRVRKLANETSGGRLLLVQEGGYNEAYAPLCLHATIDGLLDQDLTIPDPIAYIPDPAERSQTDLLYLESELIRNGIVFKKKDVI